MSDAPPPATLADVAARTDGVLRGDPTTAIRDVTHDSATVGQGALFACRPGQRADGHDFAPAAAAAGAAALLVERWLDVDLPQVAVPSVAAALGPAAALVHGAPSTRLCLLGVTGTNGKTTTAYLLEAILAAAGHRTGLVGTIETRIAGRSVAGVRTTPEAGDLQRLFRRMLGEGVSAAAMEVSSHGLALGRVAGTRFAAVGFTNLSQDHLDFHGDMEAYFAAKAALFDPAYAPVGVVAVDDAWGRRLAVEAGIDVVTLSARGAEADVTASGVHAGPEGARFTAHLQGGDVGVRTRLAGDFNVANALLALALAEAAGIDAATAAEGLAALPGVPGRLEPVEAGQPFTVLVDYAHTPEAVASALASLRRASGAGRVIIVLGCGGDRDEDKRPHMGRAAVSGADHAVLTSDNPRSEDPAAILAAMRAGAQRAGGSFEEVPDRAAAIARAVTLADPGDVVLIAGKGHETVQEIAGVTHPFDDREVAAAALAEVLA
ncbi:MAG: UDP-N-acetylmuramoyl-L-alanyl-D-glutamate--2,6-diaminopimelate ligase [Actinomycetota bacterium]